MGAGSTPAGWLPAGDDLPIIVPHGRVVPQNQALLLDASKRDFPQDGNGFYLGLHPVDARVTLAMIVIAGKIGTAPGIGNNLTTYKYLTPDIVARATNETNRVLAAEVSGRNIAIESIAVQTTGSALLVQVAYYNLRLNPQRQGNPTTASTPTNNG